ncbi:PREDICTED: uncharacterized protein LOC104806186 [Tarenaya hassleriana]|uniref:uncharacterized protein LOC104806186 n=1 Tax=Tarenaya hassleriana TaxID=28532 RepID=UPI00053C1687|nr:PREDICTED: uncharacterized protein LOC104806186 [Tarenaya hassleriana]
MGQVIPEPVKKVWDKWNIRGMVLLSLTLQTILILLAPQRRRSSRRRLAAVLWTSYLLADWTANYATAQITKNQGKEPKPGEAPMDKKLMALWAPFLLLHLGGPDTITALAIEDNALWQRHLLGLFSQALTGAYAVIQSMYNQLWLPILLLFVTGTIKYLERTRALYSASTDKFRDSMHQEADPGPNFAKLMEELKSKKDSKLPTKIVKTEDADKFKRPLPKPDRFLSDLEIVQYGFKFFETFKGLVVNLIFSFRERDLSRDFFFKLTPEEALRIMEVELGLIYDAFYTKTAVLHSWKGTVSRVIASGSLVAAFSLFHLHYKSQKREEFRKLDLTITYTLFLVGIALDLVSLVLFLLSDWTFAIVSKLKDDPEAKHSVIDPLLGVFLYLRKPRWKKRKCFKDGNVEHEILTTPFLGKRWSGKVYGFNFIAYCLKTDVERIHSHDGVLNLLWKSTVELFDFAIRRMQRLAHWIKVAHRSIKHAVTRWSRQYRAVRFTLYPFYVGFLSRIPDFFTLLFSYVSYIFDVKDLLDEMRFISSEPLSKNMWEFMFLELKIKSEVAETSAEAKEISSAKGEWVLRQMRPEVTESDDGDRLMNYVKLKSYDQVLLLWHIATELSYQENEPTEGNWEDREFSKILSDYMMYLLMMQPKLMSQVSGIVKIRFRDTKAEADKFFKSRHMEYSKNVKEASETILSVSTDIEPVEIKGDRSQSVLFEATLLVKELRKLGRDKWKTMSKVWVELLSFAANNVEAKEHAKQLSRGGELISFVWLLMAHFGLGDAFQINKGDARAKLVVEQ